MGLKRSDGLRPGAELVISQPRPEHTGRGQGTVYAGLPSGSRPGASRPHAFLLPCPLLTLLTFPPLSCLHFFSAGASLPPPSPFLVLTRSSTDRAGLFLRPQAHFHSQLWSTSFLQSWETSSLGGVKENLPHPPFLCPTFLLSFFPLHFLTQPFLNVAIEEVTPSATLFLPLGSDA